MKLLKSATAKLVFVIMLFFVLGSIVSAAQPAAEKTTAKEVNEKAAEAIRAINGYTADQRDEAIKRAKEVLADLDVRIDRLESQVSQKWDQMDQAARRQARSTLAALRKQRNELAEWYGGLKYSSAEAWGQVKNGFLNSYEALSKAFGKAESELGPDGSAKDSD